MAYLLKEITIHTDNSKDGMSKINEVWQDIVSGKLPLMFDSVGVFQQGLSPMGTSKNPYYLLKKSSECGIIKA
jgi:hypothetical protein